MLSKKEKIERLEWLVDFAPLENGMCMAYINEYGQPLHLDMPELHPEGKRWAKLWFEQGDTGSRFDFLNEKIAEMKKDSELTVNEQLVENVNKCGGTIFGLSIGDHLPEKTINEWANEGKNFYMPGYREEVTQNTGLMYNDRKVVSFKVVGGEIFFEVSGTITIYLRAKGYKKFAEEFETKEITYSIGQRFRFLGNERYILAHTGEAKVCLIGLKKGNFWTDAIEVEDIQGITQKELNRCMGNTKFILID